MIAPAVHTHIDTLHHVAGDTLGGLGVGRVEVML
jgi:hypothetical protein